MINDEFFSVSQLNTFIRDVLRSGFPQPVWVCGEIQGYNRQKGKNHIFFQLVEKEADTHQQKAAIDLVLWSDKKALVAEILESAAPSFELQDDIEVKFSCRVDFYPPHGRVRLSVESIDPFFTLGKLAQDKQRLIEKLTKEGILEKNKLWDLPILPLHIGLVTSDDSAAYNDFISELNRGGYGFKVFLCNSLMQGKRAEKDVCAALDDLKKIIGLDLVVITRGGGSISDLSCFDSEAICRKIAGYPIPVLSGIGHEINMTVTDLAAHTHAKTPTAVAQFILARVDGAVDQLSHLRERLDKAGSGAIDNNKEKLRNCALNLQAGTNRYFKEHSYLLIRFLEKLRVQPFERVRHEKEAVFVKKEFFKKALRSRISAEHERLKSINRTIHAYHPRRTLKRGFTITRDENGRALTSAAQVKNKSHIQTELFNGTLVSEVKKNNYEKG